MSALVSYWPLVLGLLGSAGFGGMIGRWLDHQRDKRRQSDTVALDMVQTLSAKQEATEQLREADRRTAAAEHAACEARLGNYRHDLHNLELILISLLRALKYAPDRVADIVDDTMADLERRRVERHAMHAEGQARTEPQGEFRQDMQVALSAANLVARAGRELRAGAGADAGEDCG